MCPNIDFLLFHKYITIYIVYSVPLGVTSVYCLGGDLCILRSIKLQSMPFNMDVVCMPLTRYMYVCTRVVRSLMRWSGWDEVTCITR